MQAKDFAILKNNDKLAHAYLFRANFGEYKQDFNDALNSLDVNLNHPGHYIFEGGTFTVDNAKDVIHWHESGATSNDSKYTVCVIAPDIFKKDAQQLFLKILEESKKQYIFFIFVPYDAEILDTIMSRVFYVKLENINNNFELELLKMPINDKLTHIQKETKNMESVELREYTENLTNKLIRYYSQDVKINKQILNDLFKVQNSLKNQIVAPKFILEYLIVKL